MAKALFEAPSGLFAQPVEFTCAQVPTDFDAGSPVWIWLGTDNNKGKKTEWTQGVVALATCRSKAEQANGQFEIELDDVYVFPQAIEKIELLKNSPDVYARNLASTAIVGLNNYAGQVVQLLSPTEFATIGAIIANIVPQSRDDLLKLVPGAASISLVPPTPVIEDISPSDEDDLPPPEEPLKAEILDEDEILVRARQLIEVDGFGGVLFVGPPGTGKSWYARQVAIKLTGGIKANIRDVQFHPSYQYEDFVEGNVPTSEGGFKMTDKHLLQMAVIASKTDQTVAMVIDEFSRSDPARVLGDAMTYMETSMRDKDFYLTSGRRARLPSNLVFIATMNPEDRSVDEIDDAMDRRWAKIELRPNADKLRQFLQSNTIRNEMIEPIMDFFVAIQRHIEIGHAFFRRVGDAASLERLWENQLKYLIRKRFRFDANTREEIEGYWNECIEAVRAIDAQAPAPGV